MSTFTTIAAMLAERLDVKLENIEPDTELLSLGADSLTLIELVFDLEDALNIKLDDSRPDLVVVQDIVDFIDRHQSQPAGQ